MTDAIAGTAQEHQLGARQMLVENNPKRRPWLLVVLMGAVGAWTFVLGLQIAAENQNKDGTWYFGLPMLTVSMLALATGAWLLLRRNGTKTWVAWYEHGLVRQLAGGPPVTYPWDEIRSVARQDVKVVQQIGSYMTYRLLVVPAAGGLIVVDNTYPGVLDFAEGVSEAFTHVRAPQDVARLDAGERLDFGGLIDLNAGGLGQGGRRIGWRELGKIELKQGRMNIHRRGDPRVWLTVPAVGLPNLLVLLSLADTLRRRHDPDEGPGAG
ncbi:DUF6585 family protein [Kitasatospora sp. NPDC094015]|uniref:DUF6585 family protein n=1 Tax=Kitasatospora sp. NPDC094015 TaxID=3155205 RepID=UPI00333346DD